MMNDVLLNLDLLRNINEYTDLRSLCDTCSLLSTLKKYIFYKLKSRYSVMYCSNSLFRNKILSKIFNINKQLHLDLTCGFNIRYFSMLVNVHTLILYHCNFSDVSALCNIHTLSLNSCFNIRNVSALGNVHTLDFRTLL